MDLRWVPNRISEIRGGGSDKVCKARGAAPRRSMYGVVVASRHTRPSTTFAIHN